jgi:hypothetical protein
MTLKKTWLFQFSLLALACGCASSVVQDDRGGAEKAIELAKECVQLESLNKIGTKIDLSSFRVSDVIKQKDQWKVSFKPLLMTVPINRATPSNAIVYVSEKPTCSSEWTYVDNRGPHDKFEYTPLAETKSAEIVNFSREERLTRIEPLKKAIEHNAPMNQVMDEILSDSSELTGSILVLERDGYWFVHLFDIQRWDNKKDDELHSFWFRFEPKSGKITEFPAANKK